MTKKQKREIVKANLQKYCGAWWHGEYEFFNKMLEYITIFKEVNAKIIIDSEYIEFQYVNGRGKMQIDDTIANELRFYLGL